MHLGLGQIPQCRPAIAAQPVEQTARPCLIAKHMLRIILRQKAFGGDTSLQPGSLYVIVFRRISLRIGSFREGRRRLCRLAILRRFEFTAHLFSMVPKGGGGGIDRRTVSNPAVCAELFPKYCDRNTCQKWEFL